MVSMIEKSRRKKPETLLFAFAVPSSDGAIALYMLRGEGDGNFAVLDADGVHVTDVCTPVKNPQKDYLEGSALMSLLGAGKPIADSHLALHGITRGAPPAIAAGEYL